MNRRKEADKRIRWGDSRLESLHADAFRIAAARGEIVLFFGRSQPLKPGEGEYRVHPVRQIVMSPAMAKRLAAALTEAVAKQASPGGDAGTEPLQLTAAEQMRRLGEQPLFSPADRTAEAAGPLLRRIEALGIEIGLERSFKVCDASLLAKRFLLGINKETLGAGAHDTVLKMCVQLQMPAACVEDFGRQLPEANVVLFGFEEDEKRCVCKAYLEFGGRFQKAVKDNAGRPSPFPFHIGYKWEAGSEEKYVVTTYTCVPFLSAGALRERLSMILGASRNGKALALASEILDAALKKTGPRTLLFLDVSEEGNDRRSFDLNLYSAGMRLSDLYRSLSKICDVYGIPPDLFHRLYDPVKAEAFGHLAGGIDREGRDFLTFYHGVEGFLIP